MVAIAEAFMEVRAQMTHLKSDLDSAVAANASTTEKAGEKEATLFSGGFKKGMATVVKTGALAGAAAFAAFGVYAVKAADDLETAQARLQGALAKTGTSLGANGKSIDAVNLKMEAFGYTNAQVADALGTLVTASGSLSTAEGLMGTAANLAAFKHETLGQAVTQLAQAASGNTRAFKGMNITVATGATPADALKKAHADLAGQLAAAGGAAGIAAQKHISLQAAQTLVTAASQGNIKALNNLGIAVLPSTLTAAQRLAQAQDILNTKIGGQAAKAADTSAGKFKTLGAQFTDIAGQVGQKLLPVISSVLTWLVKTHALIPLVCVVMGLLTAAFIAQAVAIQLTPVGWILDGLAAIGVAIWLLHKDWKTVWNDVRQWTADAVDFILTQFGYIIDGAAKLFGWVPGIGPALKKAAAAFDTFEQNVNDALRGINNKNVFVGVKISASGAAFVATPSGLAGRAAGGLIRGRGGPTSDLAGIFALSNGELVVPAHMVSAGYVDHLRGKIPGFAQGGMAGFTVQAQVPGLKAIENAINPAAAAVIAGAVKSGLATYTASSGGGGGAAQWAGVILQALSLVGQSPSWLGTVESRMNRESGGNPTIVNRTDSNWFAGTPSVGLMQVIGPTFKAYGGFFRLVGPYEYGVSTNPLANTYAGLNYAMHRYGSLAALNRAGGYAHGGILTEPIAGIGLKTGASYSFGELGSEVVTSEKGLALLVGEVRALRGDVRASALATGRAVGSSIDGTARAAGHRGYHSAQWG